jgi:SAM-dependent methyltransferase
VKRQFAASLRCPACLREGTLALRADGSDEHEVREGELRCAACDTAFAVHRGVPELLHEPPGHILAEAAGLERFAQHMRASGWDRETVLALPDVEHGYWYVQARSMHQLLTTVPFQAGQSILDVGSNTCWAANHFAERGLSAVALDIATPELQGLYTADYFLEDGRVFFERVLGSMDAIPLASSSLDYVYCCEVLHHNDANSLHRTFAEIFRVLRPGGQLLMVNETLKTLRDPHGVHVDGVEQFEGYEHAHWALQYRWAAIRAGFFTEVTEPHYRPYFGDAEAPAVDGEGALRAWARKRLFATRSRPAARHAYLGWLNNVRGGVSMNMIATKPLRYVGHHEPMDPLERFARTGLAGVRLQFNRLRGEGAPRAPRTPEQAAERMRRGS